MPTRDRGQREHPTNQSYQKPSMQSQIRAKIDYFTTNQVIQHNDHFLLLCSSLWLTMDFQIQYIKKRYQKDKPPFEAE